MTRPLELEILGGAAVYPGHPVTIALLITHAFPSLAAANHVTEEQPGIAYCDALTSPEIPGAGGCVHMALDLLRFLRTAPEQAIAWADRAWAECDDQRERYPDRWREGQEQAERCKPLLAARADWWQATEVQG